MAKLNSNLSDIANRAPVLAQEALNETADFILILVRLYAPVDTGALRDSYQKEFQTPFHILIGSILNYSVFQEFGTSKMAAQPHLTPAFAQAQTFFQAAIARRFDGLGS